MNRPDTRQGGKDGLRAMDGNLLMASFFFGLVGTAYFVFGKKSGRMVPLSAGLGLIALPYFIPNLIAMLIVCGLLSVTPFVLKDG